MQTGLVIPRDRSRLRAARRAWSPHRVLARWLRRLAAYELGSDEKIRRHTGAR